MIFLTIVIAFFSRSLPEALIYCTLSWVTTPLLWRVGLTGHERLPFTFGFFFTMAIGSAAYFARAVMEIAYLAVKLYFVRRKAKRA